MFLHHIKCDGVQFLFMATSFSPSCVPAGALLLMSDLNSAFCTDLNSEKKPRKAEFRYTFSTVKKDSSDLQSFSAWHSVVNEILRSTSISYLKNDDNITYLESPIWVVQKLQRS